MKHRSSISNNFNRNIGDTSLTKLEIVETCSVANVPIKTDLLMKTNSMYKDNVDFSLFSICWALRLKQKTVN